MRELYRRASLNNLQSVDRVSRQSFQRKENRMNRLWTVALASFSLAALGTGTGTASAQELDSAGVSNFQRQVLDSLRAIQGRLDRPAWSPPNTPLIVTFARNDPAAPFQPLRCEGTDDPANQCVAEAYAFCDDMGYTKADHIQKSIRQVRDIPFWHLTGMICTTAAF